MAEKKANALQQPLTPSPQLAAVVGAGQVTRGDVVSKIWAYIKQHNLQNPANKREIRNTESEMKLQDSRFKKPPQESC